MDAALDVIAMHGVAGTSHRKVAAAASDPDAKLLVTTLRNLSIYYQKTTLRRFIQEQPNTEQVNDFQSLNEAYVVEDYGLVALVENIEFV